MVDRNGTFGSNAPNLALPCSNRYTSYQTEKENQDVKTTQNTIFLRSRGHSMTTWKRRGTEVGGQ